jgi:hypothetical protein
LSSADADPAVGPGNDCDFPLHLDAVAIFGPRRWDAVSFYPCGEVVDLGVRTAEAFSFGVRKNSHLTVFLDVGQRIRLAKKVGRRGGRKIQEKAEFSRLTGGPAAVCCLSRWTRDSSNQE